MDLYKNVLICFNWLKPYTFLALSCTLAHLPLFYTGLSFYTKSIHSITALSSKKDDDDDNDEAVMTLTTTNRQKPHYYLFFMEQCSSRPQMSSLFLLAPPRIQVIWCTSVYAIEMPRTKTPGLNGNDPSSTTGKRSLATRLLISGSRLNYARINFLSAFRWQATFHVSKWRQWLVELEIFAWKYRSKTKAGRHRDKIAERQREVVGHEATEIQKDRVQIIQRRIET